MKKVFSDIYKTSFYSLIVISLGVLLTFQNCGKVKFSSLRPKAVAQSCGTISMTPSNGLYSVTNVTFEAVPATGVTVTDIAWEFTKGNQTLFTSTSNPVTHTFTQGPGDYFATVKFIKDDGNGCELTRAFQILEGDLCADPAGISGPLTGFVGEETSPFGIASEACFNGIVSWDMDEDGTPDYTHLPVAEDVTHFYTAPGTYTVKAIVVNSQDNSQITLTHDINIKYQSCINPFNSNAVAHGQTVTFAKPSAQCGTDCETKARTCENGEFVGDQTFTQNPSTCKKSDACPPPNPPPPVTYSWSSGSWGACNATACGTNGTENRSVVCKSSTGANVADSNCSGSKPATSRSCSALACPAVNGACGSSNGKTLTSKPTSNLCSKGSASGVSTTDSSYAWTCSGTNGGSKASCSATRKHFEIGSCGFSLTSSNWSGTAGQPTSSYGECVWGGSMTMGSSNKVQAIFFIGDYYDTSGPYGIYRLNNPGQWTITAPGCTFDQVADPRDHRKKMSNYCRVLGTRSYSGSPMTWQVTITARNNTTGEVRVVPIKATFKPTLNNSSSGSNPPPSGSNPPSGGSGHKGGLDQTEAR